MRGLRRLLFAKLFADNRVLGEIFVDANPNQFFRFFIGECDRRIIRLELRTNFRLEISQREASREMRGFDGEVEIGAEWFGHDCSWHKKK